MQESKPSADTKRPDENAYAPPRAGKSPGGDDKKIQRLESLRKKHLHRESCIRLTGLLVLLVAVIVILTLGLVTLSELQRLDPASEGIEPWMYRHGIVPNTIVILLAIVAAVTSWGLYRQKDWGRWALTIVTTLSVAVLLCSWLLLILNDTARRGESHDRAELTSLSVMSALSSTLLLFLMWSPKGKMVFSPEYRETIRQTPHLRPGCWGILPALLIVPGAFVNYFVLLLAVLSILAKLGLIRF